MHNTSSCSLSEKSFNHRRSIKCNLCQAISHLKWNDLNYVDGFYLRNLNTSCYADTSPFTNINIKKFTKNKLRFRSKSWITLGLQKSVSIKNSLFAKFIKSNDINQKNEMHEKYKQYRNLISTLLKRSKRLYFTKFFNDNLNNLKNTWKGIKNLISLKNVSHSSPSSIYYKNKNSYQSFWNRKCFQQLFLKHCPGYSVLYQILCKGISWIPPSIKHKIFFSVTYW